MMEKDAMRDRVAAVLEELTRPLLVRPTRITLKQWVNRIMAAIPTPPSTPLREDDLWKAAGLVPAEFEERPEVAALREKRGGSAVFTPTPADPPKWITLRICTRTGEFSTESEKPVRIMARVPAAARFVLATWLSGAFGDAGGELPLELKFSSLGCRMEHQGDAFGVSLAAEAALAYALDPNGSAGVSISIEGIGPAPELPELEMAEVPLTLDDD